MKGVIVIPARYGSSRFPGKPLVKIAGITLIQRVYERAVRSIRADAVYVATDDDRIHDHVISFGGNAVQPFGDFQSGTDRIAASLDLIDDSFDQVVNVQGDEPLVDPESIDRVFDALQTSGVDMATLATPIRSEEEWLSPDVVKVVTNFDRNALYFSRSPIPHGQMALGRRHVGLYGYQMAALRLFASMPRTPLEQAESLEQLRALENGLTIRVLETDQPHLGVDRPEDVLRVENELSKIGS